MDDSGEHDVRSGKGRPHWTGKVRLIESALVEPLHWKKPCRVFVNSMSDLFHDGLSFEQIDRVFAVMVVCPHLRFQILTKRPNRMLSYFEPIGETRTARWAHVYKAAPNVPNQWPPWPAPNVWLGVSIEDQKTADERIPLLLQTPAAVRFISAEPLLGPINLESYLRSWHPNIGPPPRDGSMVPCTRLNWVIVGGESGPGARPMHPDWVRSIRDQCQAAGVPYFFKQWGEWQPCEPAADVFPTCGDLLNIKDSPENHHDWDPYRYSLKVGKKKAGAVLDGLEWREFPG